jgi:hypothetical protein
MDYTGDVISDGPSAQRDLTRLTIRKASVGAMANNVYLLTCAGTGAQLLIDAADDPPRIMSLLREGSGGLDMIVTTTSTGITTVPLRRSWRRPGR